MFCELYSNKCVNQQRHRNNRGIKINQQILTFKGKVGRVLEGMET